MAIVKAIGYAGFAGVAYYIGQCLYQEMRVARYKRRTSTNEGIMEESEMSEERQIKQYIDNHCRPCLRQSAFSWSTGCR